MNSKKKEYFLIPYFLFFIVILAAIVQYPKAELHLLMNENHSSFSDFFFRNWTEIGGGWVAGCLLCFLLYCFCIGIAGRYTCFSHSFWVG